MAGFPSVTVPRDIQTLFDVGTAAGLTDRQLLDRFANRRDASLDAAFEVLILRHGPMVLRVCRNLLREEADVADAFQATYLVLVQRREAIRRLESVGGWLYGVACRVAARARVDAARRRAAEERAALRVVEAVDAEDELSPTRDFGPVVQEELRRLPEKYRAVVVLCYWQSLTHEQAAAQLGCPVGTVRSRLARARRLLHRRLTRRGLAPLAAVVASALDASPVSAALSAVPPVLVNETIRAAAGAATGQALSYVVSGATTSLIQRVLWSMTMIKIKTAAVGLALVGVAGFAGAFAATHGQSGQGESQSKAGANAPQSANSKHTPGTALIYSNLRGPQEIVKLVPDGSIVKKGDVVCELDSAALRDSLVNQKIASINAQNAHRRTETAREIAEISLVEYEQALFRLQLTEATVAVMNAEADLAAAEDAYELSPKRGKDKNARDKTRYALEIAQARKKVLVDYTKPKRLKELKLAIENSRADELVSHAASELEVSKIRRLEREIENCKVVAPRDGKIVYGTVPEGGTPRIVSKADGTKVQLPPIELGASVKPRQLLLKIVPFPGPAPQAK